MTESPASRWASSLAWGLGKSDIQLIAGEKQENTLIRFLVQEKKIVLGEACYFVKFEESNEKNEFLDKEMSGENDK